MDYNSFWKIHCFTFFPYKSMRDQIWRCRKIGQGHLRVIIWTNLLVFEYPMVHINFQGHRPFGSAEEDFLRFLPHMGMAAILVMWPFEQTFVPPSHGGFIWNLTLISQVVSEEKMFKDEKMFKECGWRWMMYNDEWTMEPAYTLSSPTSLEAQVS